MSSWPKAFNTKNIINAFCWNYSLWAANLGAIQAFASDLTPFLEIRALCSWECRTREGGAGRAVVFQRKWSHVTFGWNYSLCNVFRKGDAPQKGKTADGRSLKVPWMFACFLLCQQCRLAVALCELLILSLYLLVFWWMANTSPGINSPRLHLQEQDTELWNPQGMGKVALSVPANCGVWCGPTSPYLAKSAFSYYSLWGSWSWQRGTQANTQAPAWACWMGFHLQGPVDSALF